MAKHIAAMRVAIDQANWVPYEGLPGESAIASQEIATAVGPKTAYAYLTPYADCFQLVGNYISEGRNVLSTCTVTVKDDFTAEQAASAFNAFAEQAEAALDQSYARSLYLRGMRPRP